MRYASVNVELLDCINLHGLKLGLDGEMDKLTPKLLKYARHLRGRDNHKTSKIFLRENPLDGSRYLILDGEHRSFSSYVYDEKVSGTVYDSMEEIEDPLLRINFNRSLDFHLTAEVRKKGEIKDIMDEGLFINYMGYLQGLKNGRRDIRKVILALEKFWQRVA